MSLTFEQKESLQETMTEFTNEVVNNHVPLAQKQLVEGLKNSVLADYNVRIANLQESLAEALAGYEIVAGEPHPSTISTGN